MVGVKTYCHLCRVETQGPICPKCKGSTTTQVCTVPSEPAPKALDTVQVYGLTETEVAKLPAAKFSMWAVGKDYGTEGKRAPVALVPTEEEAMGLKELFTRMYFESWYIVEVPVWPEIAPDEPPPRKK